VSVNPESNVLGILRCLFSALGGLLVWLCLAPGIACGWAERGHDLVTRVAARLVNERITGEQKYGKVLVAKEHMLAHLANIPDTYWRDLDPETVAINGPTHYFNLEYVSSKPNFATMPLTIAAMEQAMAAVCEASPEPRAGHCAKAAQAAKPRAALAGTAAFRIKELYDLMVQDLRESGHAADAQAAIRAMDRALLHAGLLSHFVADLAHPFHTTTDYDGFGRGLGGIHVYFEGDIVMAMPLTLDARVFEAARKKPFAQLGQWVTGASAAVWDTNPLAIAYALILDSHQQIAKLVELDRKFAVTKASIERDGFKVKAERRAPSTIEQHFRDFATKRLALAADTLAHLWLAAWKEAGSPDLKQYDSKVYFLNPPFLTPTYQ